MGELERLAEHAGSATVLLKELANQNRLMIFCCLGDKELSVSEINSMVALSQSALSQHLARMREAGFVGTRKEKQTVFYRIIDPNIGTMIHSLKSIYCPDLL